MAIPFCFTHDLDWQDDCPGCIAGKSVRGIMKAYRRVHRMQDLGVVRARP